MLPIHINQASIMHTWEYKAAHHDKFKLHTPYTHLKDRLIKVNWLNCCTFYIVIGNVDLRWMRSYIKYTYDLKTYINNTCFLKLLQWSYILRIVTTWGRAFKISDEKYAVLIFWIPGFMQKIFIYRYVLDNLALLCWSSSIYS